MAHRWPSRFSLLCFLCTWYSAVSHTYLRSLSTGNFTHPANASLAGHTTNHSHPKQSSSGAAAGTRSSLDGDAPVVAETDDTISIYTFIVLIIILIIGAFLYRRTALKSIAEEKKRIEYALANPNLDATASKVVCAETGEWKQSLDSEVERQLDEFLVLPESVTNMSATNVDEIGRTFEAKILGLNRIFTKVYDLTFDAVMIEHTKKELFIMKEVRHPHVVSIMGISTPTLPESFALIGGSVTAGNGNASGLVSDASPVSGTDRYNLWVHSEASAMENGSLENLLQHQPHTQHPLPVKFLLKVLHQAAQGMCCLHNNKVLHNNLRSSQLVLSGDFSAAVANFYEFGREGRLFQQACHVLSTTSSVYWMAPEMLRNEELTERTDAYCFSVIIWEVLHPGCTPYEGLSVSQTIRQILQGAPPEVDSKAQAAFDSLYPAAPPGTEQRPRASTIKDTIHDCLDTDPSSRLDMASIRQAIKYSIDELSTEAPGKTSTKPILAISGAATAVDENASPNSAKLASMLIQPAKIHETEPIPGDVRHALVHLGTSQEMLSTEIYRCSTHLSETCETQLVEECKLRKALKHPNIVEFVGICIAPPKVQTFFEFDTQGTVSRDVLQRAGGGQCTLQEVLEHLAPTAAVAETGKEAAAGTATASASWPSPALASQFLLQISEAMTYLHSSSDVQQQVHGRLVASNCWLFSPVTGAESQPRVKISGFGLSMLKKVFPKQVGSTYRPHTPYWIPPEAFAVDSSPNPADDAFAFGFLIWEMWQRKQFTARSSRTAFVDMYKNLMQGKMPLPLPQGTSVEGPFAELATRCWSLDRADRPSFKDISDALREITEQQPAAAPSPAPSPALAPAPTSNSPNEAENKDAVKTSEQGSVAPKQGESATLLPRSLPAGKKKLPPLTNPPLASSSVPLPAVDSQN